ncbi:hypothetical protein ACFXPS_31165 [Nocardia sp. NPDC059091]|uniref:hypothetical protein n=1 Tax=unclassified Nocardia TaxID=2637762 RepID=UPI00368A9066
MSQLGPGAAVDGPPVDGFVADVFGEWRRMLPTITRDPEYASIINDKNLLGRAMPPGEGGNLTRRHRHHRQPTAFELQLATISWVNTAWGYAGRPGPNPTGAPRVVQISQDG